MRSSSHSRFPRGNADRAETEHPQRDRGDRQNRLYVVGIGPGSVDHLTKRAMDVLAEVEAIAGYTTYIDLIRPLIAGKTVVSTPMKKEVDRVEAAVDLALGGTSCAVVSSGDPGVYAMAGLVFEMCRVKGIRLVAPGGEARDAAPGSRLKVEVVPGISALNAGGSLLGAPLTHDFAAISLSDLLTPWEVIEKRLRAAAEADFVIAIYNPKSRKRHWQLERAREIIMRHRDGSTPVGVVARAMREDQRVHITTLARLPETEVDMQTTVFIGNGSTFAYMDHMVTPRGYSKKYAMS